MKHQIKDWGIKELKEGERLIRKLKNFFAGIGLAFTTAIFVLGFFILILWFFYFLRQLIENRIDSNVTFSLSLTKKLESPAPAAGLPPGQSAAMESPVSVSSTPQPDDGLIYAGYTDLFSGVGGLSQSETTMYRDDVATAMMFPPSLEWSEKSGSVAALDFSSACLPAQAGIGGSTGLTTGNSCLSAKGTVLTLNGSPLKLPIAGDVRNITADAIGNGWAVGIVLKESSGLPAQAGYAGYAYRFDGKNFTPIFPGGKAFDSQYEGQWGFGGTADDFLAVYGAYQGKGYRVRGNNISDISQFFDVRVMLGGIRPGIVKVGNGNHTTWYLFNKDRNNRAVFVKLFQNGTADIAGEADISGTAPVSFSYLVVIKSYEVGLRKIGVDSFPFLLSVYVEKAGSPQNWDVTDNGFKIPSGPVSVTSINLNNYANTEVPYLIGLTSKDFSAGNADISFETRNTDNGKWEAVSLGTSHWFSDPHGAALEWRMRVKPGNNPEFTPYLGSLLVEYKVKRL